MSTKLRGGKETAAAGPGDRMESAHLSSLKHAAILGRKGASSPRRLAIEKQDTYTQPDSAENFSYLLHPANLLRAESTQSMSNVVDKDLPINQIHREQSHFKKVVPKTKRKKRNRLEALL